MFHNSALARIALALGLGLAILPAAAAQPLQLPPSSYVFKAAAPCLEDPERARRPPRAGQARYDVCADQMALLVAGLETARRNGQLLLVEIGATWCVWCAVLQGQLHDPALKAIGFDVDQAFHILPIGVSTLHRGQQAEIPSGRAVLDEMLARASGALARTTPFIVVIDPRDTSRLFARNLDDLALTSEGRFDQARLSNVLRSAHDHVRQHAAAPSEPGWFRRKLIRWWNS